MKTNILLALAALLLCGGCHPVVPGEGNRPYEPDTPVPATHDGVFRSEHGFLRFDGDGVGIAIDFDSELAALTGLPAGERRGTYEFLSGELPPHGSLPVRYDVAHELRISAGGKSSVVQLGLVQGDGKSCQSGTGTVTNAGQLSLLAVTVAMECFLVFMAGFVQGCKVFGALFDGAGL